MDDFSYDPVNNCLRRVRADATSADSPVEEVIQQGDLVEVLSGEERGTLASIIYIFAGFADMPIRVQLRFPDGYRRTVELSDIRPMQPGNATRALEWILMYLGPKGNPLFPLSERLANRTLFSDTPLGILGTDFHVLLRHIERIAASGLQAQYDADTAHQIATSRNPRNDSDRDNAGETNR